jgi:hypothetical protein
MTLWMGKLEVKIMASGARPHQGRHHRLAAAAEDLFSGDLVEADAACYTGDAYLADWPATLDKLAALKFDKLIPGRGPALTDPDQVQKGLAYTRDFVSTLYGSAQEAVARAWTLNACMAHTRKAMDPKFGQVFIYEHCLPFDVTRAHDEAAASATPRIWTAERDQQMWHALQQACRPSEAAYARARLLKKPPTKRRHAEHLHLPQVRVPRPPEIVPSGKPRPLPRGHRRRRAGGPGMAHRPGDLQGVPVLLLDDDDTVSIGSRGVCYAKRALEVLDRYGCRRACGLRQGRVVERRPHLLPRGARCSTSTSCPSPTTTAPAW